MGGYAEHHVLMMALPDGIEEGLKLGRIPGRVYEYHPFGGYQV
jgi:hypothetical protein